MSADREPWEEILDSHPEILNAIDKHGYCDVSSKDLKEFKEPRNLCYIPYRRNVPSALADRQLSVLAVTNREYRIARTDPFVNIPESMRATEKQIKRVPETILTLQPDMLTSESKMLDAAHVSGVLNETFGEPTSLVIRGREYTGQFDFGLPSVGLSLTDSVRYNVAGVQVEVDGGYEGVSSIHLVEVKTEESPEDMNLRQVVYPHLHYQGKFPDKAIKSYLMFCNLRESSYDIHDIHIQQADPLEVQLGVARKFALHKPHVEPHSRIQHFADVYALEVNPSLTDREAPFPQADRFEYVLNGFQKVADFEPISKADVFQNYQLETGRQHDYYSSVLVWLKLVQSQGDLLTLTNKGEALARAGIKERICKMAEAIFSNEVFYHALRKDNQSARKAMRTFRVGAESTFQRRLLTVNSWIDYFRRALT